MINSSDVTKNSLENLSRELNQNKENSQIDHNKDIYLSDYNSRRQNSRWHSYINQPVEAQSSFETNNSSSINSGVIIGLTVFEAVSCTSSANTTTTATTGVVTPETKFISSSSSRYCQLLDTSQNTRNWRSNSFGNFTFLDYKTGGKKRKAKDTTTNGASVIVLIGEQDGDTEVQDDSRRRRHRHRHRHHKKGHHRHHKDKKRQKKPLKRTRTVEEKARRKEKRTNNLFGCISVFILALALAMIGLSLSMSPWIDEILRKENEEIFRVLSSSAVTPGPGDPGNHTSIPPTPHPG